jgi:hypothetical protein
MTHNLSLGAINKFTGEYVYPKIANKKDESKYICPECNKNLTLCQGRIRAHYFRHKVENVHPCHHYNNPTESQIHKDAKILLKNLLERKIPISLIRNCCCCKKNEEYEIEHISETPDIQIEYRFEYNGPKTADVAYLENGDISCIFEMCHTHKTCSENRPEPWFEIDAQTLINIANDNSLTSLQIPCVRCEKCELCIETEKNDLISKLEYRNENKLKWLQVFLKKENEKYYDYDNDWGRGYDRTLLNKTTKCIENIQNNIEFELVNNKINYQNDKYEYFIVENKNKETIKISYSDCIINGLMINENLKIDDISNWYHDINLSENIITKCFEYSDCINNLDNCIHNKNIHSINTLLIKIKKYISEIYKSNDKMCDFEFETSIGLNKLFECELVINSIDYSCQFASGTPIYKIRLPNTNEYIKYSSSSKKIYMNKIWHKNLDINSLLYGKICLNVPFSDKDQIKRYGGIWDHTKKKWYVSKKNKNIEFILGKWKEEKF